MGSRIRSIEWWWWHCPWMWSWVIHYYAKRPHFRHFAPPFISSQHVHLESSNFTSICSKHLDKQCSVRKPAFAGEIFGIHCPYEVRNSRFSVLQIAGFQRGWTRCLHRLLSDSHIYRNCGTAVAIAAVSGNNMVRNSARSSQPALLRRLLVALKKICLGFNSLSSEINHLISTHNIFLR